jgi:hypothetical protein
MILPHYILLLVGVFSKLSLIRRMITQSCLGLLSVVSINTCSIRIILCTVHSLWYCRNNLVCYLIVDLIVPNKLRDRISDIFNFREFDQ